MARREVPFNPVLDDRFTMADTRTFKQHAFSTENDQVEGYRRLSWLAVWSLPLGLLSALSMVSPLLWFVPLVAVTFALGGLRQIARSSDTTGRRLALTGLALAVLFGTWGMSWTISRRIVLDNQAREHAGEWLGLMRDQEFMKAHQLSIDYFERLPTGSSLETYYAEPAPKPESERIDADVPPPPPEPSPDAPPLPFGIEASPYAELYDFMNNGIPKTLVKARGQFDFEFVRNDLIRRDGQFATKVDQIFHVTFSGDHEPREMDVKIEMKRTVDSRQAYWQVGPVTEVNSS